MARTSGESNSSASSTKFEKPLNESTNKMASTSNRSNSTHNSINTSVRRKEIASSMNKFLEGDPEIDYLENLTSKSKTPSSRSIPKTQRKKVPSSYRRISSRGIPEGKERENSNHSSRHRRPNIPSKPRSSASRSKPKSTRVKISSSDAYDGNLNDEKPKESAQSLMASARRLLDKAARAASPGKLRKDRSSSPGPRKTKNKIEDNKSGSSSSNSTAPSSGEGVTSSPTPETPKVKSRPKSPGRLKKRDSEDDTRQKPKSTRSKKRAESPGSGENPTSAGSRKRPESPGRLKKRSQRSQSPGKLKKRSQSPGALRKTARPRRRPENREDGNRARSNGPMKKPERARSQGRAASVSRRSRRNNGPSKPPRSTRSTDNDDPEVIEGDEPLKKDQSYSDMQDELNRYKVKRNKSMDAATRQRERKTVENVPGDEEDDDDSRRPPRRANSMLLSREMGRRGKSNSLADLVQYKEEEIHSTSYFASNHVLINRERMKRGLRPLTRNVPMDELARKCAEKMAESTGLTALPTTYVGNVLRGKDIRAIHRSTMLQKQGRERQNILNPYFQDFGVGTCKGQDGMLYMCQLFSERLEITLTDTTKDMPPDETEAQ